MPLAPLNECGVHKFVCTTLHPSLPPFPELYMLESCARFVSDILTYEPLSSPLHPPSHIPSPMSVLAWQTADAFDASMVLCSLLLGAGYNAFVAMGYATLQVTVNDQSGVECPLLEHQPGAWWTTPTAAAATAAAAAATSSSSTGTGGAKGHSSTSNGASNGASSAATPGGGGADPRSSAGGASGGSKPTAAVAAADEPGKRKKYQIKSTPELASKFLQEHPQDRLASEDGRMELSAGSEPAIDARVSQVRFYITARASSFIITLVASGVFE